MSDRNVLVSRKPYVIRNCSHGSRSSRNGQTSRSPSAHSMKRYPYQHGELLTAQSREAWGLILPDISKRIYLKVAAGDHMPQAPCTESLFEGIMITQTTLEERT